jgi:uncharacterized protein (DUF427 family)
MKIPGPDHPITIEPSRRRVRAAFERHVIGDTNDAVILHEANYRPVYYLPIEDMDMSFMSRTDHHTTCPYKGEASYWSIYMDGVIAENVAWAYEEPYPSVAAIKGRIAFYPDKVEVYEVDEADLQRTHTLGGDAGSSTL